MEALETHDFYVHVVVVELCIGIIRFRSIFVLVCFFVFLLHAPVYQKVFLYICAYV